MKFLKSHFALSRSQQNGIFILVLLIIILQVFLLLDFFPESKSESIDQSEIESFQKKLDSVNRIEVGKRDTIYPFNPNYLTDFKGYQLGMKVSEIDQLLEYRAKGKWVNSIQEFQKITGISDTLLNKIGPSLRFPEWTQKAKSSTIVKPNKSSEIIFSDINSATAEDFKRINGIGDVLSQRIVKYRLSLGGFLSTSQLQDVYGLSPEVIERIKERFQIQSRPDIKIKNINSITVTELAEIPYFSYQIAKEIISYRNLHEHIGSFEELIKIDGFPADKIDRIKLYLALE